MATAKHPRRGSKLGSIIESNAGWKVRYTYQGRMHTAGHVFHSYQLADEWLAAEDLIIARNEWTPPAQRRAQAEAEKAASSLTLSAYAEEWIDNRTTRKGTPLAPRTQREYRAYLSGRLSDLAVQPIASIDQDLVAAWFDANQDAPALRHHCYSFLRAVMASAVKKGIIAASPCAVEHGEARPDVQRPSAVQNDLITSLGPADIAALAEATQPAQWQVLVLLLAYTGLRPGEALALTPADVTRAVASDGTPRWQVRVTKAMAGATLGPQPPKTPGSIRFVPLPPHVAEVLDRHMARYATGPDVLLFPSTNPANPWPTIQQVTGTSPKKRTGRGRRSKLRTPTGFNAARIAIGRPELRLYDLRRWARHAWRAAGVGDLDCELLLGHVLGTVQGAYVTQNRDALWPAMVRISVAAGWTPPAGASAAAPAIDPRLLAAMTPDQLAGAFAGMPDARLAEVVPLPPPEVLARALTAKTHSIVDGESEAAR